MSLNHVGRHRAPEFRLVAELTDIATNSVSPAVKASAVAVASGGLVATFAMPAAASTPTDQTTAAGQPAAVKVAPLAVRPPAVVAPAVDPAPQPEFGIVDTVAAGPALTTPEPLQIAKIAPPTAATAAPTAPRASRSTTRPVAPSPPAPASPGAPASPPAVAPAQSTGSGGILGIAASLSGIPYLWGGTTTSGFDCSGYTGYVYRQVGKSIPRTAEQQRVASTKVANPTPGDLIFFGYPAYHVGIYAGAGKMYASSRPGEVSGLKVIWTQKDVSYGRF